MSFTRNHGVVIYECDNCGNFNDTETKDFEQAKEIIKSEGWITHKEGQEWKNYCSNRCFIEATA